MKNNDKFMRECFRLAQQGAGGVSPNPLVGALLVKNGKIVARGYHRQFGAPHAEVDCLKHFKGSPKGLTLYVNLEPCAFQGKTPPCADLIIRSGIKRVVIGMKDPNPMVNGSGIRKLRQAGIGVEMGVLKREAEMLNKFFVAHIRRKWPYVHVKVAQTLDGYIAGKSRTPVRISGEVSEEMVHRWRSEYDAVLVGARTIVSDDPRLTVRKVKGRDPDVVILDGNLSVPVGARVFTRAGSRTIFLCASERSVKQNARKAKSLKKSGVEILEFDVKGEAIPLIKILKELYTRRIGSILVEGGGEVFGEFVKKNLADEISVFVGLRIMGEGIRAFPAGKNNVVARWEPKSVSAVGVDLLLQY
jgi:diaminohydroxyphosphoribosylaminopyrimidine deaminase / 5-amino-6-(5-phosphoribosylamino)uracil reductase